MDILIESTSRFEQDLSSVSEGEKDIAIQKINDCAALFPEHKINAYRKLRRLPLSISGYDSSLYTMQISPESRIILTVDEDPIFDQVIFTLFGVANRDDFNKAYQVVVESLYKDLLRQELEVVLAS
ncbi:MAG: hypothetical protein IM585_02510 [Pseudanabaena sp. M135S2SP2A07QC]|nr:hypothetical protein [Pseudanabaena sp. M090S1SP2A07QC]MCA6507561.1 hypothetical protein [Pseudanabaena sp. M172S2SP2A07QC]MCA6518226.1 hypothetical protein [Pseudanabaena sp. M110S1SP2A07QC]MCA6522694.1 hypothetical protein [Pseudanabaena sp. M051S1SP2A07QC]MCA6528008.1 hypothetical protein [Pseudanabaena sp. M179S2SP2A07QC]MCA6529825.1 hypothetical protein [Pseudanabaena sp. M125S2SP2A07QC]MCA6533096.1 hypothetical protein [Pseudanabaena sp. M176S2SP2A07QC]MCA6539604.1 hypothetical prot